MQKNFTITHIGDTELSLPMPFIYIPAKGKTFMFQADDGTEFGTKSEGTPITFEKDYWLCAYPTTQEFWEAVVIASKTKELEPTPSHFKGKTRPVERVSWDEIQLFNKLLNELFEKERIIKVKDNRPNGTFGLPSETQWEYAANANQGLVFAGSQSLNDVGWYSENGNNQTMPVGLKQPNAFGLYDMSGNVWEWCENDFERIFTIGELKTNNNEIRKALRGGCSFVFVIDCQLRFRFRNRFYEQYPGNGFRSVFSPS